MSVVVFCCYRTNYQKFSSLQNNVHLLGHISVCQKSGANSVEFMAQDLLKRKLKCQLGWTLIKRFWERSSIQVHSGVGRIQFLMIEGFWCQFSCCLLAGNCSHFPEFTIRSFPLTPFVSKLTLNLPPALISFSVTSCQKFSAFKGLV